MPTPKKNAFGKIAKTVAQEIKLKKIKKYAKKDKKQWDKSVKEFKKTYSMDKSGGNVRIPSRVEGEWDGRRWDLVPKTPPKVEKRALKAANKKKKGK